MLYVYVYNTVLGDNYFQKEHPTGIEKARQTPYDQDI